jgi:perosamine synthetase
LDPTSVAEKVTPFTRAIIPVHLNGCPADMDPILEIARRNNLFVVEDAAQAHGARYKDRLVGTIGNVGCFSFWEDKLITTLGEGGMVITDDDEVARRARMIHHHGELRHDGDYYTGERLYLHPFMGYNFRMTEIQGAVGLVQLSRLDGYIAARRRNSHTLTNLLSNVSGLIPPYEPPEVEHVFYKYILRLNREELNVSAQTFVQALSAEGIRCSRRYPTPLHQQPVFTEKRGFGQTQAPFTAPWYPGDPQYERRLPNAEQLPNELVMIRMSPNLQEEDINDIAVAVRKVAAAFQEG